MNEYISWFKVQNQNHMWKTGEEGKDSRRLSEMTKMTAYRGMYSFSVCKDGELFELSTIVGLQLM